MLYSEANWRKPVRIFWVTYCTVQCLSGRWVWWQTWRRQWRPQDFPHLLFYPVCLQKKDLLKFSCGKKKKKKNGAWHLTAFLTSVKWYNWANIAAGEHFAPYKILLRPISSYSALKVSSQQRWLRTFRAWTDSLSVSRERKRPGELFFYLQNQEVVLVSDQSVTAVPVGRTTSQDASSFLWGANAVWGVLRILTLRQGRYLGRKRTAQTWNF